MSYEHQDYQEFLQSKIFSIKAHGLDAKNAILNPHLFPFQKDLVRVALKVGRFCLWASTGMGKSLCQLSWADAICSQLGYTVLILAPLGVAKQTVGEGKRFGIWAKYCADNDDIVEGSINITNYDRLHLFDCSQFGAVVLDEASILKNESGKYRNALIKAFANTPYKLACSATPAPNDYMELGSQCEFLGVMSQSEMLSMYFTHDGGETAKWRLKKHATDEFWKFVCNWAIILQSPSDIGYDGSKYVLPPLHYHNYVIKSKIRFDQEQLFLHEAKTLAEQRHVRKVTMKKRCQIAADLVSKSDDQWLIWCETNAESSLLASLIPDAVEVVGSDKPEFKESSLLDFALGKIRVLVTKPSIAGMGLNFQSCHNLVYIGLTHSFEAFYQSVRRVWRFGQKHEVNVYIIQHAAEGAIIRNLQRKEEESKIMISQMLTHVKARNLELLKGVCKTSVDYNPECEMIIPDWLKSDDDKM
jgi:superfamily II DNA or RNA helicase